MKMRHYHSLIIFGVLAQRSGAFKLGYYHRNAIVGGASGGGGGGVFLSRPSGGGCGTGARRDLTVVGLIGAGFSRGERRIPGAFREDSGGLESMGVRGVDGVSADHNAANGDGAATAAAVGSSDASASVDDDAFAPSDPSRKAAVLEAAYAQCDKITSIFAKTFYQATKLMNEKQRKAVWAIYVWCRRTDDLVDGPRAMMNIEGMKTDLVAWEERLYDVWEGKSRDSLDMCLYDTKLKYPDMEMEPFLDMIKGMAMDTPGDLGKNRYETWDELYVYCYRVASTVGLMTLPVMGTAPGYSYDEAKAPAIALGIALQITNILRDVGEDAVRGRIYLPREDMARFGVTEQQILNGKMDENYKNLIKFEIQRARDYYAESDNGIPMLDPGSRLAVQAAGDIYGKILEKLEANDYDNFRKRAYVSKMEKFLALPSVWAKVQNLPKERA